MILCIGTTPAAQRVMLFNKLTIDTVNRAVRTLDGAAGKSVNVAKVLKVLGEEPVATGFLGGDRGEEIGALLVARGIDLEFVTVATRTRQCLTIIDESAGTQTELVEESQPVSAEDYEKLLLVVQRRLQNCKAVIMSGTITIGGPARFYFDCTVLARKAGAMPIIDAQGAALTAALEARPALVKPNRAELASTLNQTLDDETAVMSAIRELFQRGAEKVVVTAGKEPVLAFDGQQFWKVFSPPVKAVNPIGSGDAFTAGLVSLLVRGDDLGEACRWAAAAGAANALTAMAGEVNMEDVQRLARDVNVERLTNA
jgi:tagatose 6-phosphate kinase